jgi:uncharacterized protein YjiS (DUF1127 family)
MTTRTQFDFAALSGLEFRRARRSSTGTGWLAWMRAVAARWRERRILETLDDRALRDIGISRSQALAEAAKPFWRR